MQNNTITNMALFIATESLQCSSSSEQPIGCHTTSPLRRRWVAEMKNGACGPARRLARPERFELTAPKFVAWCSIQLSYGRVGPRIIWKGSRSVNLSPAITMGDMQPNEKQFHGWRLLGVLGIVIGVLAIISAIVDFVVLK